MNRNGSMLEWKDISDLLSSKYIDSDTDISITGGEPFLHENILPMTLSLYREGFRLNTLSTNGTHEERLLGFLSEIEENKFPFPDIHISFDGNEKNHDFQRGVP
jgi:organic radical activating enzyme